MKKLEIIIRPEKLEELKEILNSIGIAGMTVSMVSGCGKQKGRKGVYRGTEYSINLLPKVKVEVVVSDKIVETIIEKVISTVRTGEIGDGKIFIYDVYDVVKVRTGERGEEAL
ncbi:P-II family nitrogen regulator [Caldicellulosiruptoraceae bacterium PP1]